MYVSFLRKMVNGGYRRKKEYEGDMRYVLTNEELLRMGKTTDIAAFVKRQQRNYLAHIVRKDNSSIVKRLLFNNDIGHKPGRQATLLTAVMKSEGCTRDEFFTGAAQRKY